MSENHKAQIGAWLIAAAVFMLLGGIGLMFYSGYYWLKYGQSPEITIASIFGPPYFEWVGVERIALWISDRPLGIILIVSSVIVGWLGSIADEWA